jgi:hypothetical protein
MYETSTRRRARPLPDAGVLAPWIDSFELSLRAAGMSDKTVRTYTEAAIRLAAGR